MNKGLSSNRTGYNSSNSLWGGDQTVDSELDSYFSGGGGKKKGANSKKKGQKNKAADNNGNGASPAHKKARKAHIPQGYVNLGYGLVSEDSSLVFSTTKVTGQSKALEKDYLRLTSAADPANVRPPSVLSDALNMVKRKWIDTQNYEYVCNQLKSIRQDCTVQHLRNSFTVEVYETHARIALEFGDFQEFAVVQTQLQLLYKDGHTAGFDRECEFAAYKILYSCLMTGPSDAGLVSFINGLDDAREQHSAVQHALSVRSALLTTNFAMFFTAYQNAPNMSAYILDPLADSMRVRSARIMVAAYRPRMELAHMARVLAFGMSEEEDDAMDTSDSTGQREPSAAALAECKEYLEEKFEGMFVFVRDENAAPGTKPRWWIDCKATHDRLAPTNAAHMLPINSRGARHSVSASSATSAAAAASPMHAPIAAPHDVSMWIKRDSVGLNAGRIKLGAPQSSARPFSLSSPSITPSPSPPPAPIDDAVSRKRRNSQPLSSMSHAELQAQVDEMEAILLDPDVKSKYDDFSLALLISRSKALQKQLKKTKK